MIKLNHIKLVIVIVLLCVLLTISGCSSPVAGAGGIAYNYSDPNKDGQIVRGGEVVVAGATFPNTTSVSGAFGRNETGVINEYKFKLWG